MPHRAKARSKPRQSKIERLLIAVLEQRADYHHETLLALRLIAKNIHAINDTLPSLVHAVHLHHGLPIELPEREED
jgi:hypothetical protein